MQEENQELTMPESAEDTENKKLEAGKKERKWLVALGCLAIIVVAGIFWFWTNRTKLVDSEAEVQGTLYSLTSRIDGRVAKVAVVENQKVREGEPLILLDDTVLKARLAEERSRLNAISAKTNDPKARNAAEEKIRIKMQLAREQESAAQSDVEHLSTEHAATLLEVRRLEALSSKQFVSPATLNKARLAELTAREALEDAKRQFEQISRARVVADGELTRYRAEVVIPAQMPNVEKYRTLLESRVQEAQQNLALATIAAPTAGVITKVETAPGTDIKQGQTLLTLAPSKSSSLWILAYFDTEEKEKLQTGLSCSVTIPESGNTFAGLVDQVGDSVQVDKAKVRSGIPARIILPEYNPETMQSLHSGMKAQVKIK